MGHTWFRMHNRTRNNRKAILLNDANFRAWINLLCVASDEGGIIPGDFDELAVELRCDAGRARDVMQVLISARLMVKNADGSFSPKDWKEWQYQSDSSTERTRKYRMKRHGNVTVTVPDSESDTESEDIETIPVPTIAAPSARKKSRTQVGDFQPNRLEATTFWTSKGRSDLDSNLESEKFRDHHLANGSVMADWPAAWRTWYRNAVKFNRREQSNGRSNSNRPSAHRTFITAAAELAGYDTSGRS